MANPILVLANSGAVYPVRESPQPQFVNLNSPDGALWLAAPLATAAQGGVTWVPPYTAGPTVNWVKVGTTYRCTPDNGATPIAVVVDIIGEAPTEKG